MHRLQRFLRSLHGAGAEANRHRPLESRYGPALDWYRLGPVRCRGEISRNTVNQFKIIKFKALSLQKINVRKFFFILVNLIAT